MSEVVDMADTCVVAAVGESNSTSPNYRIIPLLLYFPFTPIDPGNFTQTRS